MARPVCPPLIVVAGLKDAGQPPAGLAGLTAALPAPMRSPHHVTPKLVRAAQPLPSYQETCEGKQEWWPGWIRG